MKKHQLIKLFCITQMLALVFVTTALASSPVSFSLNGAPHTFASEVVLENGQTKVTLEDAAGLMKLTPAFDSATGTITLQNSRYTLKMALGDYGATANSGQILLNSLPEEINGAVYVPLSSVVRNAGGLVSFDVASKTAKITVPENLITISHAGSLKNSLTKLTANYTAKNPGTMFNLESAGSIDCIKKVSEQKRPIDIVMSADYIPMQVFMFPEDADWNLNFVGNTMVLMYTEKSKLADTIDASNWYKLLAEAGNAKIGTTDPAADPGGYRSHMVVKLAEIYYNQPGLYAKIGKNMAVQSGNVYDALKAGTIDYVISYDSNALQNGFKVIELPSGINLTTKGSADTYSKVSMQVDGKEIKGAPIQYGLTVPKNAAQPVAAYQFIKYLGSEEARAVFAADGFNVLKPMESTTQDTVPQGINYLLKQ